MSDSTGQVQRSEDEGASLSRDVALVLHNMFHDLDFNGYSRGPYQQGIYIAQSIIYPVLLIFSMHCTPTLAQDHIGYDFARAGPKDKRSPCPALNSLANHGYMYVILFMLV